MLSAIFFTFNIIKTEPEIIEKAFQEVSDKTIKCLNDENFINKMYTK